VPEPLPPPSLSRAREQKISELSQHFANDDLSLEDLERRIERVYKAISVAELDAITADLTSVAGVPNGGAALAPADRIAHVARDANLIVAPSPAIEAPRGRLLSIMSSHRRVGRWTVPRDLHVFALWSDSRLDLTTAVLPVGGVVNIEITSIMASFRVIVSPDMHVINDMHAFMSDMRNSADAMVPGTVASARTPVIRLTGTAFMSDFKVKVRRREEPLPDDD